MTGRPLGRTLARGEYKELERVLKSHCLPECLVTEAAHSRSIMGCIADSLSPENNRKAAGGNRAEETLVDF